MPHQCPTNDERKAGAALSSFVIGGALVGHSSFSRVLFLTHRVPFPPDKGDRIRTFHLLRQMAKRGRVWLGCLADEPVPPESLAALNELCERVAAVPVG